MIPTIGDKALIHGVRLSTVEAMDYRTGLVLYKLLDHEGNKWLCTRHEFKLMNEEGYMKEENRPIYWRQ